MNKFIVGVLVGLLVGLVGFALFTALKPGEPLSGSSGTEHTNLENFFAGARFGAATNQALLEIVATTTTWNPPNVPIGGATSTEVSVSSTVTGFSRGLCSIGGFTLASSSGFGQVLHTGCLYGTSTAVISLSVPASSSQAVDIGTSTVTIYQLQF